MRTRTTRLSLAIAALALVGAACTSDDDAADDTAATTPATDGEQPVDTEATDGTTADTTADTEAPGETTPGEEVQTGESVLDTRAGQWRRSLRHTRRAARIRGADT